MDETKKQTKIEDINPLEISDKQLEEFDERVRKIYSKDNELYNKVRDVVIQLNMGGLWRGREATILIVANAIKGGNQ